MFLNGCFWNYPEKNLTVHGFDVKIHDTLQMQLLEKIHPPRARTATNLCSVACYADHNPTLRQNDSGLGTWSATPGRGWIFSSSAAS